VCVCVRVCVSLPGRGEVVSDEVLPAVHTVSALLDSATVPLHHDVMASADGAGHSSHVTPGHVTDV